MTRSRHADERGGAALLTMLLVTATVVLGVALVVIAVDLGTAAARARTAADAAALAGMAASPLVGGDGDVDRAASALARANAATVVEVDRTGWPLRVLVIVEADPRLPVSRAAPPLRARAAAQLRPDVAPLD